MMTMDLSFFFHASEKVVVVVFFRAKEK